MDFISRRALLGSTALVALVGVAGCASSGGVTPTITNIPKWVLDAVSAFAGALDKFAVADLPPAVAAKIATWIQFAQSVAAQLATADFSTAATLFASLLKVPANILSILAAAGIVVPGPLGAIFGLFAVLAPSIGSFFNLPTSTAMMLAHKPEMSFDEALSRLQEMAR